MSTEILLGCGMIVICMAIQCVVVSLLLWGLRTLEKKHLIGSSIISSSALLIAVLLVLLAGNLFQAVLWAAMFLAGGEFEDFSTASTIRWSTSRPSVMAMW